MTDVSIVIVSYNVSALLRQCLQSVFAQATALHLEVIVVDNNSSDGSPQMLAEEFPRVILLANQVNAGFSGANNQGMKLASGEHIFLLNPDTELRAGAVEKLHAFMKTHGDCAIVAPRLLNSDGSLQVSAWKEHKPADLIAESLFLHKIHNRLYYDDDQFNSVFEPAALSGAALYFHRELMNRIGYMNERLFWMEDVELCHRALSTGKLYYLPSAQVVHHSGQSQKRNYNVAISNQLLSKLKYYRKYFSIVAWLMAVIFCFLFIISRILMFILLAPAGVIYRRKLRAYVYTLGRYFSYLFLNDRRIV
jgi:GT2 family glycosyltransferase